MLLLFPAETRPIRIFSTKPIWSCEPVDSSHSTPLTMPPSRSHDPSPKDRCSCCSVALFCPFPDAAAQLRDLLGIAVSIRKQTGYDGGSGAGSGKQPSGTRAFLLNLRPFTISFFMICLLTFRLLYYHSVGMGLKAHNARVSSRQFPAFEGGAPELLKS